MGARGELRVGLGVAIHGRNSGALAANPRGGAGGWHTHFGLGVEGLGCRVKGLGCRVKV